MLPASRKNFLKFTEIVDMSTIRIPTSFNIDLEFELPEFHKRFLAWLIDIAIIGAYFVVAFIFIVPALFEHASGDAEANAYWGKNMFYIPAALYWIVLEILLNGQTVGKKALKIRVINMTGGRPSWGQLIIRWLLRPIDITFTLGLGGLLTIVLTKYAQRLGDLAAGTILIATNETANLEDTVFMEMAQDYVPQYPQVMQLSDRDLNTIRSLLEKARTHDNFNIAATATEKIKTVLHIETTQDPFYFLETLLKDYNYLSVQ